MFHYVFLDPRTIDEAARAGEMGLGRLIELLQGFRRDVILAETDSWRVETEIGDRVRAIPSMHQHERKLIGDLLIWMRRNSPILLIDGDYDAELPLADFALLKAEESAIDLIIGPGENQMMGGRVIKANLARFHQSELNQKRIQLANGIKFEQGTRNFEQVANECFRKLVRHAENIRIFDYALGKFYNNDQPVNLKKFVRFLRDNAPKLQSLEIVTLPHAHISLDRDIGDLRNEVDFRIILAYRHRESDLPHPRYFGADRRYLDIDRGIDLCDANDLCRLTQIKYAGAPE